MARFYGNYIGVTSNEQAYDQMRKNRTPTTAVVEGYNKSYFGYDAGNKLDKVLLVNASFNSVTFEVSNHIKGFLSFSSPNDSRWRATVDGNDSQVYKTNGIENGVFLTTGKHQVQFWYKSTAEVSGAVIGTTSLVVLGILLSFFSVSGWKRFAMSGVVTVASIAMFSVWYYSLYHGNNLETRYSWTSADFPKPNNLAYGKPTQMSTTHTSMPYFYYSGLGVDEDINGRPFFTISGKAGPWWQVDLGNAKPLGEIVIHDERRGQVNIPLNIETSMDGLRFQSIRKIQERGTDPIWRVYFSGEQARFVRLQSMVMKPMSFYEIEIYPYKENSLQ